MTAAPIVPADADVVAPPHPPQPLPFFLRIAAFAIDAILLGIAGQIAGLFLSTAFAALGPWGRVAGGAVGVLYFGISNSHLTRGRSVGKMLTGIAVRHISGAPLALPAAFGRAVLLMLPVTMNQAAFVGTTAAAQIIAGVLVFGLGGVTLYLLLFNRATRQTVHDLVVRSVVVRTGEPPRASFPPVPRKHFVIPIVVLAIGAAAVTLLTHNFSARLDFPELEVAQRHIIEATGSSNVQVMQQWDALGGSQRWLVAGVNTYSTAEPAAQERLANRIAGIMMRDIASASSQSKIVVSVAHGYDVLFASSWKSQVWALTPAEWRRRIAAP